MVQRKRISVEEGQKALEQLDHIPSEIVSARRFILENFDTLRKSGKSLKATHQYLLKCGIDVGSFAYFRDVYNREKRVRKLASLAHAITNPDPPGKVQIAATSPAVPDLRAKEAVITVGQEQTQKNTAHSVSGVKTRAMNSSKSGIQVNPDSTFNLEPVDPDDLPSLS